VIIRLVLIWNYIEKLVFRLKLRQEKYEFQFYRLKKHEANSSASTFFSPDQQQILWTGLQN
jgi:hypothetical protein